VTAARRALGASGEAAVAAWYRRRGYEVVARNWRCPEGELDVVVRRGPLVVICEVKTRSSTDYGPPAAAVTLAKQRRLRRAAAAWLRSSPLRGGSAIRFDVAAVVGDEVEVIEGAF
jgi:putative endonuclease